MTISDNDLVLYVMGEHPEMGAIETELETDASLRQRLADEARWEASLRDLAGDIAFCPGCGDVVAEVRCPACGAAASAGGFEIEKVLVQNARGRLYLAKDADGRRIALKELAFVQAPSAQAIDAFEREARFLRSLDHPAIPRFVASFREEEGVATRLYLAQEYIDGVALDRHLAEHRFTEEEILRLCRQVLDILAHLQSLSPMIVHRDVKPANLVLREDDTVALVDFGAAYDRGETMGTTTVGTYGYMPMEQLAGLVDATTDTYALGASLLHLLTRREPWKLFAAPSLDVANVSPGVRDLLAKMTARSPSERFATALEALEALGAIENGIRLPAVEAPHHRRRPPHRGRRAWLLAAVLGATTATGAVTFSLLRDEQASDRRIEDVRAPEMPVLSVSGSRIEEVSPPELPVLPAEPRVELPPGPPVTASYDDKDLADSLRELSAGRVNLVLPGYVRGTVNVSFRDTPWQVAIEEVLQSNGLWYVYEPDGKVMRVAHRPELDDEAEDSRQHQHVVQAITNGRGHPRLPAGRNVDLEFKDADLTNFLRLLGDAGGVNLVIPQHVRGSLTVRLQGVPWDTALEAILQSQGLWYRYREDGAVVRIAARSELREEDRDEYERRQNERQRSKAQKSTAADDKARSAGSDKRGTSRREAESSETESPAPDSGRSLSTSSADAAKEGAPAAASSSKRRKVKLRVGDQEVISARSVSKYSLGASSAIDVVLSNKGTEFIVRAQKEGRSSLLLIYENGDKIYYEFTVSP